MSSLVLRTEKKREFSFKFFSNNTLTTLPCRTRLAQTFEFSTPRDSELIIWEAERKKHHRTYCEHSVIVSEWDASH
ncbi:hypothetical protein GCK32_022635 [Trichostrongylus colubriformis]|uniref:Uncharacterized protein n=1 Tax=Trichostrongylus colubriformis TaxID=6319 RepID=A0AAN8IUF3_TRICO